MQDGSVQLCFGAASHVTVALPETASVYYSIVTYAVYVTVTPDHTVVVTLKGKNKKREGGVYTVHKTAYDELLVYTKRLPRAKVLKQ